MFKFLAKVLENMGNMPICDINVVGTANNASNHTFETNNIYIQTQDITGNWRTYHVSDPHPHMILSNMQNLSEQFPDQRIRAVDENNRIVDIL